MTSYRIKVKDFEGPLELLLELIEKRKLSINEISLGVVAEDYFNYIKRIKMENEAYHEEIAAFLVIAATLMLIKSRSLLPGFAITQEEEADIKELEERLANYKRIKKMAEILGRQAQGRRELFGRSPYIEIAPSFLPPAKGFDLLNMASLLKNLVESIPKKVELQEKTVQKIVSIEEKIEELKRRIEEGVVKTFGDFIGKRAEKVTIVVSFLAMLELIKIGIIAVQQSYPFDLIHIKNSDARKND